MKSQVAILFSLVISVSLVLAGCGSAGKEKSGEPPQSLTASLTEEPLIDEQTVMSSFAGLRVEVPDCSYGGEFKSIAALDEFTVKFSLCYPDAVFLSKVASTAFAIQPAEHLEATDGRPLENPVGTGPYVVETWEHGNRLVLKAFPDYWGEAPKTKTLVFRWEGDPAQRLLALQSGRVDGIDDLDPADFDLVSTDPGLQLVERSDLNVMYFGFNNNPDIAGYDNSLNPFANEEVRRAIAMGIDRQSIVDNFYPPGSKVATHFTPCAIPNGCAGDPWYDFDPEIARRLLAQAGYPEGFETKIYYRNLPRSYIPQPKSVVENLQSQLKDHLNIDAEIVELESNTFLEAATFGHLDGIHVLGWEATIPDQINFLDKHFGTGTSAQFGDKFEDITKSLAQAAQHADNLERKPFYVEANNEIQQHVPAIPVAWGGSGVAYNAAVFGAQASPLKDEKFASTGLPGQDTFTWSQDAEPASLYCPDETDSESLRACGQIVEALYGYEVGSAAVKPVLAEKCEPSDTLNEWTCTLRQGVKFHDGSLLDANDVVESFVVQWDAANPLHTGDTGTFAFFHNFFGEFLNTPGQ